MSKHSRRACLPLAALFIGACVRGHSFAPTEPVPPLSVLAVPLQAAVPRPREARMEYEGNTCRLVFERTTIVFTAGSRRALVNDVLVWLNAPPILRGGRWTLPAVDARLSIAPLLHPTSFVVRVAAPACVVLDAGHGGTDSGARAVDGTLEKNITLDLCRRTKALLEQRGVRVCLTRRDDTDVALGARAAAASLLQPAAFVSVHLNSSRNAASRGVETYLLTASGYASTADHSPVSGVCPGNSFDGANMILAYRVHSALLARSGAVDRGVKRARFLVLREAPCPAILVEAGFLSNAAEARAFTDSAHLDDTARRLAEGIAAFLEVAVIPPPPASE